MITRMGSECNGQLHISPRDPSDPNSVAVSVNIRTIFTVVGTLVLHPTEARYIDFVTGLQFFRRFGRSWLWCGILSGCLPRGRLEFGSCGHFNRLCLWFRTFLLGCFLLRNRPFFLLCQCCGFLNFSNGRFLGAHSGFCGWDGCFLPRPRCHVATQRRTGRHMRQSLSL